MLLWVIWPSFNIAKETWTFSCGKENINTLNMTILDSSPSTGSFLPFDYLHHTGTDQFLSLSGLLINWLVHLSFLYICSPQNDIDHWFLGPVPEYFLILYNDVISLFDPSTYLMLKSWVLIILTQDLDQLSLRRVLSRWSFSWKCTFLT